MSDDNSNGNSISSSSSEAAAAAAVVVGLLDLETSVVARYSGEARIQRLMCIAAKTTSTSLQKQAYQAAAAAMKESGNYSKYKEVFGGQQTDGSVSNEQAAAAVAAAPAETASNAALVAAASAAVPFDASWCIQSQNDSRQSREILQSRLEAARSHLNKEAVRQAHVALADYGRSVGDLQKAYHSAVRARDYCTSRQQTADISLLILELALDLKNYPAVKDYVNKLEHTLLSSGGGGSNSAGRGNSTSRELSSSISSDNNKSLQNKVLVASALAALAVGEYHEAATKLVRVVTSPGGAVSVGWDAVLAAEEITLYAAYLSMSCSSRTEVAALAQHVEALELQPAARTCLTEFAKHANYAGSWKLLEERIHPLLAVDVYMADHLTALQDRIRENALLLYWKPYQQVEWSTMLTELGTGIVPNQDVLVSMVVNLIKRGKMPDTRLDMAATCLVREEENHETEHWKENDRYAKTATRLSSVTRHVLDDAYSMIIRLACIENDWTVRDPSAAWNQEKGSGASSKRRGRFGGGMVSWGNRGGDSSDEDANMDVTMVDAADAMNPEDLY